MVVFGTLKVGEEAGNILFTGDLDQCREYAYGLDLSKYYDLDICEDNGKVTERIVIPNTVMTNGQKDILKYVESKLPGVKTEAVGLSRIKVTDDTGKIRVLSINIFGDIQEVSLNGEPRVIAKSDLPHTITNFQLFARPNAWETL